MHIEGTRPTSKTGGIPDRRGRDPGLALRAVRLEGELGGALAGLRGHELGRPNRSLRARRAPGKVEDTLRGGGVRAPAGDEGAGGGIPGVDEEEAAPVELALRFAGRQRIVSLECDEGAASLFFASAASRWRLSWEREH